MSIFPDHFRPDRAVTALAGVLGRRLHGDAEFHVEVCRVGRVVNVMADLLAKRSRLGAVAATITTAPRGACVPIPIRGSPSVPAPMLSGRHLSR